MRSTSTALLQIVLGNKRLHHGMVAGIIGGAVGDAESPKGSQSLQQVQACWALWNTAYDNAENAASIGSNNGIADVITAMQAHSSCCIRAEKLVAEH